MRKTILFTLLCALCLGAFAGCGAKSDPFMSVVSGGKTIALGMTQAQVDKILGEKGVVSSSDSTGTVLAYATNLINVTLGTDAKKLVTGIQIMPTSTAKTGLGIDLTMDDAAIKALAANDPAITVTSNPGMSTILTKTINGTTYQETFISIGAPSVTVQQVAQ